MTLSNSSRMALKRSALGLARWRLRANSNSLGFAYPLALSRSEARYLAPPPDNWPKYFASKPRPEKHPNFQGVVNSQAGQAYREDGNYRDPPKPSGTFGGCENGFWRYVFILFCKYFHQEWFLAPEGIPILVVLSTVRKL